MMIRITMTILILGVLVSCSPSTEPATDEFRSDKKTLRYDVNAPFGTLDPHAIHSSGSNHVFPLLYSYLFVPDAQGNLQPDLAETWAFDKRARCWNIRLKQNLWFHNGQPVTAMDVKYSYEKWLRQFSPTIAPTIKWIDLRSDHELAIYLNKEDPTILHKLWAIEIFPHVQGGKIDYMNHPVGSGPFRFSHRKDHHMVTLIANPDYHAGRPLLNRIVFYYQPDREKAWTRLLAKTTDIAQEISPQNYKIMQQYEDRFYFDQYILPNYTILLYNTFDPLFSDAKVRNALTLAINRNHIVNHILKGYGQVAAGPMGVDSPYAGPTLFPLPHDPGKAMTLLKQTGWSMASDKRLYKNHRPFEFTILLFKESQIEKEVARFIQLCLNDIGIQVHLKALEFEELKKRYEKNTAFQAVLTELAGAHRTPEVITTLWLAEPHSNSIAGCFSHPQVTQLLLKAFSQKSPSKQRTLLQQIDTLIADLQPGTFLFHKTAIDAMSRRFYLPHRFNLTHEGIYLLKNASLNYDEKPFD